MSCGKPAVLMSYAHGCPDGGKMPPFFSCIGCWKSWYKRINAVIAQQGRIKHSGCGRFFETVEDFSDYREF